MKAPNIYLYPPRFTENVIHKNPDHIARRNGHLEIFSEIFELAGFHISCEGKGDLKTVEDNLCFSRCWEYHDLNLGVFHWAYDIYERPEVFETIIPKLKEQKRKILWVAHELNIVNERTHKRNFIDIMLDHADYIVAINEKDYKFLKTNSKAKHIALVPLFLTNSFFGKYEEHRESYGRSKFYFDMPFYEKKTFCYYGFIRPNKGIVELMAAWNSIRGEFPDWKLKIYAPNATLDTKVLEEMQAHFNDQIMWQSDGYTFLPFDAGEFGILPYQQCNNSSMICELIAYGSPTVTTDLEPFADYAEYRSNDITSIIRYGIANAAEMRRGIFEKRRKLFRQNHKAKKALFDLACKIYQDTLL